MTDFCCGGGNELVGRLIRLDVLVDPQHVFGIILFLDLYQTGVVRTVRCSDRISLVSPNWFAYTP